MGRKVLILALVAASSIAGCAGRRPKKPAPVPQKAKAVIRTAKTYLPEENFKGKNPKDCSDFVGLVFAAHGIALPRTAVDMSILGARVKSSKELRMGDLVFFSGEKASRIVGHVGIYVNNGIFIHLSQHEIGVREESLYSDYYRKRYLAARRLIK
ncbi:MAG: C40 family peptidase [Elusimicrobia bacterium]|nr:C40 family peptidase [Elusimicrobiota bacterium]